MLTTREFAEFLLNTTEWAFALLAEPPP